MKDYLFKLSYTLEHNKMISALRKGFVIILPIFMIGCFSTLIRSLPISSLQAFLLSFNNGILNNILLALYNVTSGFMSIYLIISITYTYAEYFDEDNPELKLIVIINAIACFLVSFNFETFDFAIFGLSGVFSALIVTFLSIHLFFFIRNVFNKYDERAKLKSENTYQNASLAILPLFICIFVFLCGSLILVNIFNVNDINELISVILLAFFSIFKGEFILGLLFTFFVNILWAVGIHGGNALHAVQSMIFPISEASIVSKSFLDTFIMIGGCGTSLSLAIALLFKTKSKPKRKLALLSFPLALFNMNELLVYGLPIVLNPIMIVPFIIAPLVAYLIAYSATYCGFVPLMVNEVGWSVPVLFSGAIGVGSLHGVLIQLINLIVGVLIYLPFIKMSEKNDSEHEAMLIKDLVEQFKHDQKTNLNVSYLSKHDGLGAIARTLVNQLRYDIERRQEIPMFYQPQVKDNEVISGESLLRWRYNQDIIYPPLVIALSKEDGCYNMLTWNIITQVGTDIKKINSALEIPISISVNISAQQLNDETFVTRFIRYVHKQKLNTLITLEVTEETDLSNFNNVSGNIDLLRQNSIYMAIDDFGMGQTSLNYLEKNTFKHVKIDGELVRQLEYNPRCAKIVKSIVDLGKNLDYEVIAECVETEDIKNILLNMNCTIFQGYLYSPALALKAFIKYCQKKA